MATTSTKLSFIHSPVASPAPHPAPNSHVLHAPKFGCREDSDGEERRIVLVDVKRSQTQAMMKTNT
ncbi:hypothetical protein AZE42_11032 [Rhizopogon vesiculosus]|uniref:Uncharacterized protein n=1 Tax=Rhizopogon vesiculosus TaxID=180088 RepID=A0A1J8PVL8_9AGAM|nr:hypothetical protein AZE42_11032 [Rhizopogon vesiculosus]